MRNVDRFFSILESIVDSEKFVLVDNNVLSRANPELFYSLRDYRKLDVEEVREGVTVVEMLPGVFSREKVHTIQEVVEELEEKHKFIRDKLRYCNNTEQHLGRVKYKEFRSCEEERKVLEEYSLLLSKLKQQMKGSLFRGRDDVYTTLEASVISMEDILKIKLKVYPKEKIPKIFRMPIEDKRTDEKLLSAAIYMSLVHNTSAAIVTTDCDLDYLARVFNSIICHREVHPQTDFIRESLENYPVKICLLDPESGNSKRTFCTKRDYFESNPRVKENFGLLMKWVYSRIYQLRESLLRKAA